MKKILFYIIAFANFIFCCQPSSAKQIIQNPFTIDENTKKIIEKYIVQGGDTLSEISERYKVSIQGLSSYNNLKTQKIYIGQKLLIPLNQSNSRTIDNGKKELIQKIIKRGNSSRNQQQYEEAIADYNEALDLDPFNIDAYHGIGYSDLRLGLQNKAIESFIRAVKIDPYNPASHFNLGLVYFLLKEKKPAFEQYKILRILNENYATRLLMYLDSLR